MNKNNKEIYDFLKCPICFETAKNPIECTGCSHVYCKTCLSLVNKDLTTIKCPTCRKKKSLKTCALGKKLLGAMKIKCPNNCKKAITKSDLNNHLKKCPKRSYECVICGYK